MAKKIFNENELNRWLIEQILFNNLVIAELLKKVHEIESRLPHIEDKTELNVFRKEALSKLKKYSDMSETDSYDILADFVE